MLKHPYIAKPVRANKPKLKSYIVVSEQSLWDLEEKVNALIDEGYTPTGGITFVKAQGYGAKDEYHQPMILDEEARQDAETAERLASDPEMQALMKEL